jgi:hypothetical protein
VWQNRIIGYGEEAPDQLLANPFNPRVHTQVQEQALNGVLQKVGVVQNVLVNRTTGHMIDGHLRAAMAISQDQSTIPVTYVELTEEEEKLVLATFDPLSAMAGTDKEILASLCGDIELTGVAALENLLGRNAEIDFPDLPDGEKSPFQTMTFVLHDEQAEVVSVALKASGALGPFLNTGNENSNGNALARICETFLTEHANG